MLKMKRLVSLLVLGLGLVSVGFGQQDAAAKKILDAVNAKYKGHTSFQASMTYKLEVTTNTSLNETFNADVKVKGNKFYLKKSDGEQFICNGVYVWNIDGKEAYVSDFDPDDKIVDLTKVLDAYKTGYKYVKMQDETIDGIKCNVIDLSPVVVAKSSSDVFKIRILVNPLNNDVKQWVIFEKNGNRHKFKINSYTSNVAFPETTFNYDYKKYPAVSVEDLTDSGAFSK